MYLLFVNTKSTLIGHPDRESRDETSGYRAEWLGIEDSTEIHKVFLT